MSVLLLRLSGPLQSWGDDSRYNHRRTRPEPTKSGVVGLVASALGRTREEPIGDLASLEFGVRSDQPGKILRDFQTEGPYDVASRDLMPLTYRYYLADACFLAALSGADELIQEIDGALKAPAWPLYLGRRSCPADMPLSLGVHEEYLDVRDALERHEWVASDWYKSLPERVRGSSLEVCVDAREGERGVGQDDFPLSFSLTGRKYARRFSLRYRIPIPGVECSKIPDHDPLGFF